MRIIKGDTRSLDYGSCRTSGLGFGVRVQDLKLSV